MNNEGEMAEYGFEYEYGEWDDGCMRMKMTLMRMRLRLKMKMEMNERMMRQPQLMYHHADDCSHHCQSDV